MTEPDSAFAQDLVRRTQRTELSEASAARIAKAMAGAAGTLAAVAPSGLFDTEPAQFDRALRDCRRG